MKVSISNTVAVEQDADFDKFAITMKNKEDWNKVKKEEEEVSKALSNKVDVISSVHQEISKDYMDERYIYIC